MTTYIGTVSCDLHPQSVYVRVLVSGVQHDNPPLSIRATFAGYSRKLFKKGTVVEVEDHDYMAGRRYRVSEVFEAVEKPFAEPSAIHRGLVDVKYVENYSPSKEQKVQFFLGSWYFENCKLIGVLNHSFGITHVEYQRIERGGDGLTVICTTDQFARFLIARDTHGIKNGFMDLKPKLVYAEPMSDAYQLLADMVSVTRERAKRVAVALGYETDYKLRSRLNLLCTRAGTPEIDVSARGSTT